MKAIICKICKEESIEVEIGEITSKGWNLLLKKCANCGYKPGENDIREFIDIVNNH